MRDLAQQEERRRLVVRKRQCAIRHRAIPTDTDRLAGGTESLLEPNRPLPLVPRFTSCANLMLLSTNYAILGAVGTECANKAICTQAETWCSIPMEHFCIPTDHLRWIHNLRWDMFVPTAADCRSGAGAYLVPPEGCSFHSAGESQQQQPRDVLFLFRLSADLPQHTYSYYID